MFFSHIMFLSLPLPFSLLKINKNITLKNKEKKMLYWIQVCLRKTRCPQEVSSLLEEGNKIIVQIITK